MDDILRQSFRAPHQLVLMVKKCPNPIDKYVGSKVRARRQTLGISQRKLGDALGVSFQQIQNYENGTNRIVAGRLQQLSLVLQAPPAFFFQNAPSESVARSSVHLMKFLGRSDGTALASAFMRLDVKLRWRIVHLVQALADSGR
jgi:transcriptional regulator with XRE-family HTH domain